MDTERSNEPRSDEPRSTESGALHAAIKNNWDERVGLAIGEARIAPGDEAHQEAARLVPEDTPGHKPVSVHVKGSRYDAHRCRRYPETVVFAG